MFFKKKLRFAGLKEEFYIFSLFDENLKKFYSLVLQKSAQEFLDSLCYTYDRCKDNELLKVNKDNLVIFKLGFFNAINGVVTSQVRFMGRFDDLIDDYNKKKFKVKGANDERESIKDTNKI